MTCNHFQVRGPKQAPRHYLANSKVYIYPKRAHAYQDRSLRARMHPPSFLSIPSCPLGPIDSISSQLLVAPMSLLFESVDGFLASQQIPLLTQAFNPLPSMDPFPTLWLVHQVARHNNICSNITSWPDAVVTLATAQSVSSMSIFLRILYAPESNSHQFFFLCLPLRGRQASYSVFSSYVIYSLSINWEILFSTIVKEM